jgi:hypothetical protein
VGVSALGVGTSEVETTAAFSALGVPKSSLVGVTWEEDEGVAFTSVEYGRS